jgi:hypothetical protein
MAFLVGFNASGRDCSAHATHSASRYRPLMGGHCEVVTNQKKLCFVTMKRREQVQVH